MSGHTPGPWTVGNLSGEILHRLNSGLRTVAAPPEDIVVDDPQWRADAALIAAAPDLLETLERCEEYVERAAERCEDDARESLASLRAAIAKAKGGAP